LIPTFKPGKYGQASTVAPSAEKLHPPGWIREKGVLVNTPTFTWVYTRTEEIQRRGKFER
jgi:hypothetical protein